MSSLRASADEFVFRFIKQIEGRGWYTLTIERAKCKMS